MRGNSVSERLEEKMQQQEAELAEAARSIEVLTEALKESEDRYDRQLENLKDEFLFYSHDPEGKFTFISQSYLQILGYTQKEYIGLNSADLWTDNPINIEADKATRLSCQGVRQPPYEIEIYHKDGSKRRFVTIELPIFDNEGNLVAVEGTSRDITEKRKNEEQLEKYRLMLEDLVQQRTKELQDSKKQLADIINFFPDPLYVVDTSEHIIAWNRAMVAMTGVSRDDAIGSKYKPLLEKFYNAPDPILLEMVLDGILGNDYVINQTTSENLCKFDIKKNPMNLFTEQFISQIQGDGGGHVWVTAGPILDAEDNIAGAVESIRDVTQIKEAERKILHNEQRLSTLMSNLPGMAYRINLSNGGWLVEFVNEGCQQIFGHHPSVFVDSDLTDFRASIHPDDLRTLINKAGSAVKEQMPFECEFRVITADGKAKWVFNKAQVINTGMDQPLALEGIMFDFTVFKKMEQRLRNENLLLRSTIRDRYKFQNIIGNCPAMQDVFDLIVNAASSDDNVFIYGESGTGKELVAQAIHDTSDRKENAFVAVNCSAIPESLIESEFFGSTKGAFTGAHADRAGYLTVADGGTLFLDEIGDISPHLQVKLLRAIDDGGFSPVGSKQIIRPDLRIVAASNKNLEEMMHDGAIRQDFFFRIHVIPIHLPPLREREDDIFMLVNHYLKKLGQSESIASLAREELETLKKYSWPGNVRELQNVLRRYIALKNLDFMKVPPRSPVQEKAPLSLEPDSIDKPLKDAMLDYEKAIILKKLEMARWNKSQVARDLSISRKTLFRKMKSCGLK